MDTKRRIRRWLRWTLMALAVLLAADQAISLLLATPRLRALLTARLATAFGRGVEVRRYGFTLLPTPRLEAHSVTVAEDPRFGQEYFLRAAQLTANLRWKSLLRGQVEFGTFSFTRPSLNLVRLADGRWNLEDWLPPAATSALPAGRAVPRLYRLEVDNGRINFKRGADKHPLALVGVTGRIEQESAGLWRIDLEARPMRAAVVLQDAGRIRVRGRIGGTSARLRPADLQVGWEEVSLSDALRLLRGYDYGVRGRLALEFAAHSEGEKWEFTTAVRARSVHRWDLPLRPGNPALNLNLAAELWPHEARLELTRALLEAPRSSVHAEGFFRWSRPADSARVPDRDLQLQLVSGGVHLSDLLAWYRAFHPGVAEDLRNEGLVGVDLQVRGWPPRIERGVLASDGAHLEWPGPEGPTHMGRAVMRIRRDGVELTPVDFTLAEQAGALRVEAQARRHSDWGWEISVAGKTQRIQDLLQAPAAWGKPLPRVWDIEGPAEIRLRLRGHLRPFRLQLLGAIELRGGEWRPPLLNHAVSLGDARVELRPDERRITLKEAKGFGARWGGWLLRKSSAGAWKFDLTADRLDTAELDRWLNPQRRETLLERIFPVLGNNASADPLLESLRGHGRLQVKELRISPLVLEGLQGFLALDGRSLRLSDAQADFYGGSLRGSFSTLLSGQPSYQVEAKFRRVSLALLTGASTPLRGRFSGTAAGELTLTARGLGRGNLRNSLEGGGTVEAQNAEDHALNWLGSLEAGSRRTGTSSFRAASAEFRLVGGKVEFDRLRLAGPAVELEGAGSVDFARVLDLRLRVLAPAYSTEASARASRAPAMLPGRTFHLTGPLDGPQISSLEPKRASP